MFPLPNENFSKLLKAERKLQLEINKIKGE